MAEQKVKLTDLPAATDTVDTAQLLINQNSTDQKLPVTHFLRAKNNLSDVIDADQARANLNAPSVDEVNNKLTGYINGSYTFSSGANISSRKDYIWDEESKSWYYWGGNLPKEVPAASSPGSTGGIGPGSWSKVSDSGQSILSDLISTENGKGDALVGVKNTRWNGVARTQHDVNLQIVSLKDFGAKLDGVTDDTAAIQAAIDALAYNTFINDTQIPRSNREYSAYVLDGGPGIALVSSPIQIYGGVGLRNITLRAATVNTFSAQAVLKSKSGTRMWGRFENITIDGNNQDCRGVFIENGVGAFWNNIIIVNTIRDAFTCTGGIFLSDFAFKCSSVDALAGGTKSLDATG